MSITACHRRRRSENTDMAAMDGKKLAKVNIVSDKDHKAYLGRIYFFHISLSMADEAIPWQSKTHDIHPPSAGRWLGNPCGAIPLLFQLSSDNCTAQSRDSHNLVVSLSQRLDEVPILSRYHKTRREEVVDFPKVRSHPSEIAQKAVFFGNSRRVFEMVCALV